MSREERFLTAQADHFAGAKWKEKASACSVRNDGVGLGLAAEEILQQRVLGGCEGIRYGDGLPDEAGVQVFGEEEAGDGEIGCA